MFRVLPPLHHLEIGIMRFFLIWTTNPTTSSWTFCSAILMLSYGMILTLGTVNYLLCRCRWYLMLRSSTVPSLRSAPWFNLNWIGSCNPILIKVSLSPALRLGTVHCTLCLNRSSAHTNTALRNVTKYVLS